MSDIQSQSGVTPLPASERIYGIKFGRSNCSIAYVNEVGQPEVIPGEFQSFTMPSIVFFIDDQTVLVGEEARIEAVLFPERSVKRIRDYMGTSVTIYCAGKDWRPPELGGMVLKKIATNVKIQMPGAIASRVVITIPAYFDSNERADMEEAAKLAGLNLVALIPEPVAAALAYSIDHTEDQTIVVYQLGGTTFDVTVIDINDGNFEVITTDGSLELGGFSWDDRIKEYMKNGWQEAANSNQDPLESTATYLVWSRLAEQAKRQLTQRDSYNIYCDYDGTVASINLTRETFDAITSDLMEQTVLFTNNAIEAAADKGFGDINKILLVGGSSYMKQVKESVEERFALSAELFRPDFAVVHGAAKYATDAMLQEVWETHFESKGGTEDEGSDFSSFLEKCPPSVTNVSSKNFGVANVSGGLNDDSPETKYQITYLIKKNAPVPADISLGFTTSVDDQNVIKFEIIASDADDVPDTERIQTDNSSQYGWVLPPHAQLIGSMVFYLPEKTDQGDQVNVRIQLSEDGGRLRVTATHGPTGHSSGLTFE